MKAVGEMIRKTRKKKGLTLQQLSEKCGLSVSFLSQVERGLSSLSITSLWVITQALDVPISNFFNLSENPSIYIKCNNHKEKHIADSSITYTSLSGPMENKILDPLLVKVPGNYSEAPNFSHEGEEFAYVIEGEIAVTVQGKKYTLGEGDSIHFPSEAPHKLENDLPEPAKVLWVLTLRLEGGVSEYGEKNVH